MYFHVIACVVYFLFLSPQLVLSFYLIFLSNVHNMTSLSSYIFSIMSYIKVLQIKGTYLDIRVIILHFSQLSGNY